MWRTKTLEYLSQRIQRSKGSVDKRLLRSESILRVPWLTVAAVAMKDKSCAGPQPDPWTPDPICPGAGEPGQQQLEADTSSMYREVRVTTSSVLDILWQQYQDERKPNCCVNATVLGAELEVLFS